MKLADCIIHAARAAAGDLPRVTSECALLLIPVHDKRTRRSNHPRPINGIAVAITVMN
jgi:hypothetical protein